MSNTNSKNFTFLILLGFIVLVTFTYIIITNNVNETIYTDIREVEVEDE